jgi:hypothetical protein
VQKNLSYIAGMMEYLCQKPRTAGSKWNAEVRQKLITHYKEFGFNVDIQEINFVGWTLEEWPTVEYLQPIQKTMINVLPVVWSGSTKGNIEGTIQEEYGKCPLTLRTFEAYEWDCFPIINNENTIVGVLLSNERDDRMVWPQPLMKVMLFRMLSSGQQKALLSKNALAKKCQYKSGYLLNLSIYLTKYWAI